MVSAVNAHYLVMEKYAARELKQRISRVLWEVWDPIGVNTFPEARDEYDMYVNYVFESLIAGESDEVLAAKLLQIVHERIGLWEASIDHMRATVSALRGAVESHHERKIAIPLTIRSCRK